MMTRDQSQIVSEVYSKFISSEHLNDWDDLDDALSHLDYLTNLEVANEAVVVFQEHKEKNARCKLNHSPKQCMVPRVMEAVEAILELYKETGVLHEKNRYVLSYYLSLTHIKFIISD